MSCSNSFVLFLDNRPHYTYFSFKLPGPVSQNNNILTTPLNGVPLSAFILKVCSCIMGKIYIVCKIIYKL